jgi:hypothetical protein
VPAASVELGRADGDEEVTMFVVPDLGRDAGSVE